MARGLNKVMLIGHVGDEPVIRKLPNTGNTVANFSLATTESRRNPTTGENTDLTEWHRIVAFGKLADIIQQYVHKGQQLYIEGRIRTRSYDDKQGIKKYITEIQADEMLMLGSRGDSQYQGGDQQRGYGNNQGGYAGAGGYAQNSYGSQNSYGGGQGSAYGSQGGAYSGNQGNAYGGSHGNAYGGQGGAYSGNPSNAYGGPQGNAYAGGQGNAYAAPQGSTYGGTPGNYQNSQPQPAGQSQPQPAPQQNVPPQPAQQPQGAEAPVPGAIVVDSSNGDPMGAAGSPDNDAIPF